MQQTSAFTILFLTMFPLLSSALYPLEIKNGLFNSNNKKTSIQGINYFGFNNRQTMVDGLWAGGNSAATDFKQIVSTIHLLGFNAVRLPFTFNDLKLQTQSKAIHCYQSSGDDLIKRTIDPNVPASRVPSYPDIGSIKLERYGMCNTYLPNGKVIDRFVWVIEKLIDKGLYVIIDYHPMNTENIAYDVNSFVTSWKNLWNKITSHPKYYTTMKGRVILDLFNEPDSMQIYWNPRNSKPGATDLYLKTMDALHNIGNPLFMVEGTGQTSHNINWGDGFATDPQIIRRYGIDDPSAFFKALVRKPYLNRVIISPHVYGPTISLSDKASTGEQLFARLNSSFGYLANPGFCDNTKCTKFPILIGEFGSFFTDKRDIAHLNDFAYWIKTTLKEFNWAYWTYNQNSGDTGGIVENNWQNIAWQKIRWLVRNMQLKPWYLQP
jgi:hypothetical protein